MKSDEAYFAERAERELAAAKEAGDSRARQSHLELADGYAELSAALQKAHAPTL